MKIYRKVVQVNECSFENISGVYEGYPRYIFRFFNIKFSWKYIWGKVSKSFKEVFEGLYCHFTKKFIGFIRYFIRMFTFKY